MNTPGKVILINAEKDLLKEEGTELFGRFFLALINQAAAQRASLNVANRLPCFVYVDECHNYIENDPKIQVILAESRQQKIGVILSHQYLGQIQASVARALAANTTIKMAARLNTTDAGTMARDMNSIPNFIRDQPVGSFATYMHGRTPTAISMQFPLAPLSRFERMNDLERRIVIDRNRAAYANPITDEPNEEPASHTPDDPPQATKRRKRRDPDNE